MELIGKRHVYPLVAVHANQFVSRRFALVGDAAVGMHPVTAHGFNLGLKGQASLSKQIAQAISENEDIASDNLLKAYETELMRTTRILYHGTNIVVGLFTNETLAAKLARKATLHLANNISPIKQLITQSLTEKEQSQSTLLDNPLQIIKKQLDATPFKPAVNKFQKIENFLPEKLNPINIFGLK